MAAWFANIQYHGHEGPLPAALVSDLDFGLMSRHGSRRCVAANRLVRKLYHRGEAYWQKCGEAEQRVIQESVMASTLQRQLDDERTGIASRIKHATKAAMRTFANKFQGKIDRAKEKIKALGGNPKKKLVQLAQVEANIYFARIRCEAPDSFDAEAAITESWLPNVAGGDVELSNLFAELDSDLVISPISSDSSGTVRDNVSLETLAADVGISTLDGSMMGELGEDHDDEYVNIDDWAFVG
ncbi:hypothetical protein AALP_AAs65934U000900 [Arabis alpina]|uniref:Uncharacterized protein n=1 Tax=Arabis alpina TaxID=50452 RepID=A0A087G3R5_ARAAL|nr:hypothetical protein AALP_AAs65934U000900 [Arabis alpina]